MKNGERLSLEQIRAFLGGSEEAGFNAACSGLSEVCANRNRPVWAGTARPW
jgi:hypothetical protein